MPQCAPVKKTRFRFEFLTILMLAMVLDGHAAITTAPAASFTLPAKCSDIEIQEALDALPPNGEVILSPGVYEISRPLMLRHDYETLRGSGPSTILHLANGADCPVVILGPPMSQTKHRAAHLLLADLLIDGNRKNQKIELWKKAGDGAEFNNNGVQIWNAADVGVEHVTCCRCRSGGLVTAEVRRLKVSDFDSFDNQFDGLACYQTEESRFGGLRLHDNLAAGISLDLDFNDNLITNAVLADNDLGIFMRDSRNNSFKSLIISKSHRHGIFMAQAAAPSTECIGNSFDSLMVNDCGGKAFQVNDASCTNNVISGACFLHNFLGGLSQPSTNPIIFKQMAER
jgi:parallel beta-helix repeat protein